MRWRRGGDGRLFLQPRFAEPIVAGTKGGTIRAARRRHARPGEELQLYCGMRTKDCRLIARKTCIDVAPIRIDWPGRLIIVGERRIATVEQLAAFARFDGFAGLADMEQFWRGPTHAEGADVFEGWHIQWASLPEQERA